VEDKVYAIADTCSHANISLSEGLVWCDSLQIECHKHGSAFSLVTGHPDTLPATQPVEVFNASVVNGDVVITRGGAQ
jgi:3-phenylpropionate/trans-cinnamate dioxygenase ferredoxin subunit